MIIQTLHRAERDKPHRLSGGEPSNGEGPNRADCVEDKGFEDGGVEGAERVRDVDLGHGEEIRSVDRAGGSKGDIHDGGWSGSLLSKS